MGFWDWLTGRDSTPPPVAVPEVDPAPTEADILSSLDGVEQLIASGTLPSVVRSRAARVTRLVWDTLLRLGSLGLGSYDSYSVVATATDYLPEAIGAYLRLPRDWADSRPVEDGKTPLLLLIDQLRPAGSHHGEDLRRRQLHRRGCPDHPRTVPAGTLRALARDRTECPDGAA